jgi:glutathione S-transferase
MAENTLSILKPSVNNLSVRIFVRAAGLEFEELPDWAKEYMTAIETALGDAYSEPASDVRGYIASVKAPAA